MKLVTFNCRGVRSIGKVIGKQVVDLPDSDPRSPRTMLELLQAGPPALALAREVDVNAAVTYPLSDVRLDAPVTIRRSSSRSA